MAEVLLLGTAAALSAGDREPTCLAVRGTHATILIDCGANPVARLQRLAVPLESLAGLILTHSHPDHVAGFPLLVLMLWLAGRQRPLPIYGPADALDVARRLLAQWDTTIWQDLFALEWHSVPLELGAAVLQSDDFEILAAPGRHSVPVIGLRFRDRRGGGLLAFGADGEPSPAIQSLAQGVDLLIHEATGPFDGHSTAEAAARLAQVAGARRLVLVHLAPQRAQWADEFQAARVLFSGPLIAGRDLERYEF